jgi:hypothetical protein
MIKSRKYKEHDKKKRVKFPLNFISYLRVTLILKLSESSDNCIYKSIKANIVVISY